MAHHCVNYGTEQCSSNHPEIFFAAVAIGFDDWPRMSPSLGCNRMLPFRGIPWPALALFLATEGLCCAFTQPVLNNTANVQSSDSSVQVGSPTVVNSDSGKSLLSFVSFHAGNALRMVDPMAGAQECLKCLRYSVSMWRLCEVAEHSAAVLHAGSLTHITIQIPSVKSIVIFFQHIWMC